MPRYVLPLRKADDPAHVGVKAYVLGILFREGFPVPDGFLINNKAYRTFLVANDLESTILDLYNSTDFSSQENIVELSKNVKSIILKANMPDDVYEEISQAYKFMNTGDVAPVDAIDILRAGKEQFRIVARASVDSKFNFPGLFGSGEALGVKRVLDIVKEIWASLHNVDAIIYRNKLHINHDMDMCVMIQKQIETEKSGIAITSKKTIIESTWGMNKTIQGSQIQPDRFILNENVIESKFLGKKKLVAIRDNNGHTQAPSGILSERISLTDNEALKINSLMKRIESAFKNKIIAEWAIEGNKLYLLQCRSHNFNLDAPPEVHSEALIKGLPVSHGYTSGRIRLDAISDPKDIVILEKPIASVCISASAVISEQGSYGSSAALLCREMGVPALFGAERARLAKDNQKATLDCYEGVLHVFENDEEVKTLATKSESNRGYWIDTPGAALSLKGISKEEIVFIDIEKISRLMFGSDYSSELVVHESIMDIINSICAKCSNVFIFWRKEPENYILSKLSDSKAKNIFQVLSKDII